MPYNFDPNKLTPDMIESMRDEAGLHPSRVSNLSQNRQKRMPYTAAGLSALNVGEAQMTPGLGGFTVPQYKNGEPTGKSAIVLNTDASNYRQTLAHEMEHALELQGGHKIHEEWDKIAGGTKGGDRFDVVKRLVEHAPYLQSKWGLDPENAYFDRDMMDYQGRRAKNLLKEQFASLSAIEQAKNKKLTDDPYVRENILTTPEQRAAYNAVTGLRQTRLDPRDLPAYTPQPDKSDPGYDPNPKSMVEKIKSALGFAKGGMVDKSVKGGNKLI